MNSPYKNAGPGWQSVAPDILPPYLIQAEAEAAAHNRKVDSVRAALRKACDKANESKDLYEVGAAVRECEVLRAELASLHASA